ncbi:hypothetical protein CU016_0095 [Enterococcus lactis]|nr:hypothetical protein [Enterococcus lactis]
MISSFEMIKKLKEILLWIIQHQLLQVKIFIWQKIKLFGIPLQLLFFYYLLLQLLRLVFCIA